MGDRLLKKGLVLGIILLFISANFVSGFNVQLKNTTNPLSSSSGNTLYVGGSEPGNYTKIQDAIDNASNGDTVFVYDDLSPYYENVGISKSINLIGENKDTTIINGGEIFDVISVNADNVTIRGFTIQNSSYGSAIFIFSSNSKITDNILSHNNIGILQYNDNIFDLAYLTNGCNTISNNLIIYNEALGIGLCGTNNIVYGNIISQTEYGIYLVFAVANNISNNFISENEYGISIVESYNNVIYRNNISQNEKSGISIFCASSDRILQNNFIGNGKNAYFSQPIITMFRVFKMFFNFPIKKSIWDGNFWDRSRLMPYMVPGLISLIGRPIMKIPYIFNIFQFDWHPAQIPYVIS